MGDTGMAGGALSRETVNTPLPLPPVEGQVENLLFPFAAGPKVSGTRIFEKSAVTHRNPDKSAWRVPKTQNFFTRH